MPKENNADAPASEVRIEEITLDEFCLRLSQKDKRVELIGGFNHVETVAKRFKDAESKYQARFEAFVNAPA